MSVDRLSKLEPAATQVRDPISGRSLWLSGIVRNAKEDEESLKFDMIFKPEHTRDMRRSLEEAMIQQLRELGVEGEILAVPKLERPAGAAPRDPVPGMSGPGVMPHGGPIHKLPIAGVKHLIAVASGKGGVGKSTVATNLAIALQRLGLKTGLLDADIYGPSLPRMMNTSQRPMVNAEKKIIPVASYGVRCVSTGLLVNDEEAMIWRGPMVMGIVRQFLQDVAWGELDVLVVDLPPGTGDVQLSLIQGAIISGAVIVTTPQDIALADAVRGISMFRKLEVPLLGIVENMAYYELPDGTRDPIFGEGGGRRCAEHYHTELLAEIPLRTAIRRGGDEGLPAALGMDTTAQIFREMARKVAAKLELSLDAS